LPPDVQFWQRFQVLHNANTQKLFNLQKKLYRKFMAVIRAEVSKDFKGKVESTRKSQGISEAELIRKAVKNYLEGDKKLTPLQRAGWR
jgi:hypothetical protein